MSAQRALALPTLQVNGIHMSFPVPSGSGHVAVLSDVSLVVPPATFTAIVGPSGSGKSTLLHCAAGLDVPDRGQVLVSGDDITRLNRAERAAYRRKHIGFIFQEYNLIRLTVRDNVLLPSRLRGEQPSSARATEALDQLGLAHRAAHRPHQLSGGEQQRAAIARALVSKPRLVFADEPTGALDVSASATVLHRLRALPTGGPSVVMVTHDPQAAAIADQVLVMGSGQIRTTLPGGDSEHIAEAVLSVQQELAC